LIAESQIEEALSRVMDPELGRNLVELGMIRDIEIEDSEVRFPLALTTLACQTIIKSDVVIRVPPQEKIERRLPTARRVAKIAVPFDYDWRRDQTVHKYLVVIEPPSLDDHTDDVARLKRPLSQEHRLGAQDLRIDLPVLRKAAGLLREADWQVTAMLELDTWLDPDGPPRLVDLLPGDRTASCWEVVVDIGTNAETVLGDCDWLISCACSAGAALQGAGVQDRMRATAGAIGEVWIDDATLEPTYKVIGNERPRGICGSTVISLLAEMFIAGVMDKGGSIHLDADTPRVREGEHGTEYVVAWN
jgi:uncharacterized 2Fe-2S/4Fe-4S cluster protein (DUF4445 family)